MFAVIVAGGKGTRLASRTGGLPKPLVEILGKPLLAYQLELLAEFGVSKVAILCGFGADRIAEFCGDGSRWGLEVECVEESRPLGTAGAVISALERLPAEFLVLYGDTMVNVDLARMSEAHRASRADCTLFLHPNDHPHDSDLVETNDAGEIVAFHPYPHPLGACLPNQVNAALYVVEAHALRGFEIPEQPLDFGKHVFPALLSSGAKLHGYVSPEYIKDAGTPERLDRVTDDLRRGVVERSRLDRAQPAVFLDRDGTINEEDSYIRTPEELRLIPGAAQAICKLRQEGFRIVVATNQPVVARGECTFEGLAQIHNYLQMQLSREGAYVDAIYWCPHHPHSGYAGEVKELKFECDCRKPQIGLVRRAVADLNIDLATSWFIGDSTSDIQTAKNAGIGSILLGTGAAGRDGKFSVEPDYRFPDLLAAAEFLSREVASQPGRPTSRY
jgi:histidinol-phosphate phosphatase family protein